MAASSLVQEVICIRRLLDRLGFPQKDPTPIGEVNRTCVAWGEGAIGGSDRAKHGIVSIFGDLNSSQAWT